MNRWTRIKVWAKVFLYDLKQRPLIYAIGALLGISLLLNALGVGLALATSSEADRLARDLQMETEQRRLDACAYNEYVTQQTEDALVNSVLRLINPENVQEVVNVIHEEYDKLPPSSACLETLPSVDESEGRTTP